MIVTIRLLSLISSECPALVSLLLYCRQGRDNGPKASTSRASETARVKAELDCATLWVCIAYMPKP